MLRRMPIDKGKRRKKEKFLVKRRKKIEILEGFIQMISSNRQASLRTYIERTAETADQKLIWTIKQNRISNPTASLSKHQFEKFAAQQIYQSWKKRSTWGIMVHGSPKGNKFTAVGFPQNLPPRKKFQRIPHKNWRRRRRSSLFCANDYQGVGEKKENNNWGFVHFFILRKALVEWGI